MKTMPLMLTGLAITHALTCAAITNAPADTDPIAAVKEKPFLYELTQHLYRWYMDESDVESAPLSNAIPFWVRQLHPPLDPGDHSLFAEVVIPRFRFHIRLKKTDYTIDEIDLVVTSRTFKLNNVSKDDCPDEAPPEYTVINIGIQEMMDYLFTHRNERVYPDKELSRRMRHELFQQMQSFPKAMAEPTQLAYWSPLSPVANEVWAFWETGRMLVRFASDIDLANPAVWDLDVINVRAYDLDEQVIVSHAEAPGSNRFLTRDQVGRALYNCVILGQRRSGPTSELQEELESLQENADAGPASD